MNQVVFHKRKTMKKIVVLFLVLSRFNVFADNAENPMISNIWLVNSTIYTHSTPPDVVPIGIDMSREAYYKITDSRDVIIKGGLLNKGSNIIELKNENFFRESHSHHYILALKTDDRILKRKIGIDVKFDSILKTKKVAGKIESPNGTKVNTGNKTGNGEYSLSMFIEDRFILKERKSRRMQVAIKTKKEPRGADFGQPSHIDGSYPALQSGGIPIFPLVMGLLKKVVFKKPKKAKKSMEKPQQLRIKLLEKDSQGAERLVTVRIKIKISDMK